MKIVFMGTPAFAVPCLAGLVREGHTVCGVFTQPDKPKGRGYALTPPPVKELALSLGLPVYQPQTLRGGTAQAVLEELAPDLIAVVAYGKILPPSILQIPRFGCVNVHASLLPQYRGAAPIQWAVLNGEKVAGVTTMQMKEGVDTGDMLLRAETPVGEDETAGELHDRLAPMGASLLCETVRRLAEGDLTPVPQPEGATYAPMLDKGLCTIDWNKPAQAVHNQIRGLSPWPVAITYYAGKKLKLHRSRLAGREPGAPGQIAGESPLLIVCGDGQCVELLEVQLEGGKRLAAADFVRGHRLQPGERLG